MWCAISFHTSIIGPYFIKGRLNQNTHFEFLHEFWVYLDNMPLIIQKIYFQHDDCSAHSTIRLVQWMNFAFSNNWISTVQQSGLQGPRLNYFWFFYGVVLNNSEPIPNIGEILKRRIRDTINAIPLGNIQNSFRGFRRRIKMCAENLCYCTSKFIWKIK